VVGSEGGWQFRAEGVALELGSGNGGLTERVLILGVRPEEFKVVQGHGAFNGVIDVVEPTGPDTILTTVIGRQTVIARVEPRFAGKRGEPIAFAVDPSSVSLFDAETQMRL
jgi:multiple sugar transport system ATP-binding protein